MTWLEFLAAFWRFSVSLLAAAGLLVSLAFAAGFLFRVAEILVWWGGT
jgi:hypothetical protein